jgi:hypothetical protein
MRGRSVAAGIDPSEMALNQRLFFIVLWLGLTCGSAVHAAPQKKLDTILFRDDGILALVKFDDHDEICSFDTGSPFTVVPRNSFFSKYPVKSTFAAVTSSGQEDKLTGVVVKKILVAGQQRLDRMVYVKPSSSDQGPRSSGWNGCILGLDLLKDDVLSLNFKANTVQLIREIPKELRFHKLELSAQGHILIPVKVEKQELLALWDTGVSVVTLSPEIIASHVGAFEFIQNHDNGHDSFGDNLISYKVYRTQKVALLDFKAPDMPISSLDMAKGAFASVGVKAVIGFRMMSQYNWMIDLKNKRWAAQEY